MCVILTLSRQFLATLWGSETQMPVGPERPMADVNWGDQTIVGFGSDAGLVDCRPSGDSSPTGAGP